MIEKDMRGKIDYYCFPSKIGNISTFTDLEQYTDSHEKDYYYITQEDVLLARKLHKLLLFDLRDNNFIDENGNSVDISEKIIFPRATIQDSYLLLEYIENAGGISITLKDDIEIIENWFNFLKITRKFKQCTLKELQNNLENYEQIYGDTFFVKTIQKGFSDVCTILVLQSSTLISTYEQFKNPTIQTFSNPTKLLVDSYFHSLCLKISDSDTKLLISKSVDIVRDNYGKREWRAFVIYNNLFSLSRCSDSVIPIEDYVYDKIIRKIQELKGILPDSYVVDFFEYFEDSKVIFDIIELNPIVSSGPYQNNDLVF